MFAIVAGTILDYVFFNSGGGTKAFGQSAGKMIAKSAAGKSVASLLASKFIGTLFPKWGNWPLGRGYLVVDEPAEGVLLPNLEDASQPLTSWSSLRIDDATQRP